MPRIIFNINKTNAPMFTNSTITEILSPRLNVSKIRKREKHKNMV